MPPTPHLMCSMCDTNVDTGSESVTGEGQVPDNVKTWLISCGHVCCKKYHKPDTLDPQIIYIRDTIPSIIGRSRGLHHTADELLAERNKILIEGSALLKRFKELQEEVEKQDADIESLLFNRSGDEIGAGPSNAAMAEGAGNGGEWQF
ncbi:hypothetical protein FRC11_008081 [Ceratobasidium sp. 423]|nr:hypothetical protein FRC11_008081 [Ceratobasidium sp. 423]